MRLMQRFSMIIIAFLLAMGFGSGVVYWRLSSTRAEINETDRVDSIQSLRLEYALMLANTEQRATRIHRATLDLHPEGRA